MINLISVKYHLDVFFLRCQVFNKGLMIVVGNAFSDTTYKLKVLFEISYFFVGLWRNQENKMATGGQDRQVSRWSQAETSR